MKLFKAISATLILIFTASVGNCFFYNSTLDVLESKISENVSLFAGSLSGNVCVLDFSESTDVDTTSEFGQVIASLTTSVLNNSKTTKYKLVERAELTKILNDSYFFGNDQNLIDKLQKQAGMDILVSGNYSTIDREILINLKVIAAKSGELVFLKSFKIDNSDKLYTMLNKKTRHPAAVKSSNINEESSKREQKDNKYFVNKENLNYRSKNSIFDCSELTVKDKITNLEWISNARLKTKPMNFFDSQRFIQQLNNDKYAGFSDWRLPTLAELSQLVKYALDSGYGTKEKPVYEYLNNNCFSKTQLALYLTSTISKTDEEGIIGVVLDFGRAIEYYTISNGWLLIVRGS